jgi:acyl-CoA thioesterase FadM
MSGTCTDQIMALTIELKACYADMDAGGVVSYAAYLRYLELARTESMCMRFTGRETSSG